MAKVPIDECPAGAAMDAMIAEILDGHSFDGVGAIENREGTVSEFCRQCGEPWGYHSRERYSTSIAAAWGLGQKAIGRWGFFKVAEFDYNYVQCEISRLPSAEEEVFQCFGSEAETAPLAICRAFLKAHGIEFVEVPDDQN